MQRPVHNHLFTIGFSVVTNNDAEHVTAQELRAALARRLREMGRSGGADEILEACGQPEDSYTYQAGDPYIPPLDVSDETVRMQESGDLSDTQVVSAAPPQVLTFQSDSRGYMLYYRGEPIGGAGTMPRSTGREPPKHWRHRRADARMHADAARRQIELLASGAGPQYLRDAMAAINQIPGDESLEESVAPQPPRERV